MKQILEKIAIARTYIKAHPLKKDGKNTFSNYDYFTPELVGKMAQDACIEANIICVFNLRKDDLGYFGELITTDLESGESLTTHMRTEKPVLKATNETQQMGGMNTYTKRYCLMSLFDIEDNTIDFDNDNGKNKPQTNGATITPTLIKGSKQFSGALEKLRAGTTTIEKIKSVMIVSAEVEKLLKDSLTPITSKN